MLKYDSTHGLFKGTIKVIDESTLEINGKQIKVTSQRYIFIYPFCYMSIYFFFKKKFLIINLCSEIQPQFHGVILELTML